MSSISVMQPYLFPYIGYYQLINEVEKFVLYDDVNFITRGWINRNNILINGESKYFTVPCKDASQNKLINEVEHALSDNKRKKLLRKLKFSYGKAPFFNEVYTMVEKILYFETKYISELAIESIQQTSNYLDLSCHFSQSSKRYDNRKLDAADRLIDICKQEKVSNYINPIGGQELYSKEYFNNREVNLQFLKPEAQEYEQFDEQFVPWLSIIDVMMFNAPSQIKENLLTSYELV